MKKLRSLRIKFSINKIYYNKNLNFLIFIEKETLKIN